MRKKYLSALLFGALLFASAGTFTSCKDYDDDINNLQQQIDGLATKEDMQAKLDQMQTAVNDAKATAEEALEKANAAGDADKIAELEGRIADLEETLGDIDAMKEEIQNALDSQIADFREEMEELLKEVEELTGYSLGMVTSIEFQVMDNTTEGKDEKEYDPNLDVNYARVGTITYPKDLVKNGTVQSTYSYTFGEGLTGAFTIKSGDVNTVTDYMLVNINPANAAVSNDMLSLVNGKGTNLNEYVDMSIKTWSDDITTSRATQATGLRMVGVQLKNTVDFEAFDKLVLPDDARHSETAGAACDHDYIAYALSVTDAEKERTVTSSYDVTLHVQAETKAEEIEKASKINSSAASTSDSKIIESWADGEDAITNENCFPVALDEAFTIDVKSNKGGRVMASYVVVDYNNSSLSATDKAALAGLKFSGVDTVVKGESLRHSITISGIAGIAVPLKLVTIDYTGNIEVNNIWVKAGAAVTVNAAYTITPKAFVDKPIAFSIDNQNQMQAFTIPAGATQYSVELTAGETAHKGDTHIPTVYSTSSGYVQITNWGELKATRSATDGSSSTPVVETNAAFLRLYKADRTNFATKQSEVAYAEFVGELNLQMMREDKTYQGTIRFYDATGTYLGANSIQVTKKLPTAVPSDFSAKTNGINNGVMTVYPRPISSSDKDGEYLLAQAFNNWESNYNLIINGVTDTMDPGYTYWLGSYSNGTDYDPSAAADADHKGDDSDAKITSISTNSATNIIHNGQSYPAIVQYNYGIIKFIPEGHGTIQDENAYAHIVNWGTSFNMQFNCWPVDCTYKWSVTPEVYYRETNYILGKVSTKEVNGATEVTGFENVISAIDPYGATVDPFDKGDEDWTTWANAFNVNGQNVEIILYTNNNGQRVKNEYFTAEFVVVDTDGKENPTGDWKKNAMKLTPTGVQVKPSAPVETEVVLKLTDKFGHTHEIPALTFTMQIEHAQE